MINKETGCAITILYLLILLVVGIGWIKNITKLIHCDFKPPYKAEILHGVELFPPIGAFMGWINIKDKEDK